MAEGAAEPTETDLEQKILQVLRDAGSPVKAIKLAKECGVSKKTLNRVLYRMKTELKVDLEGLATWRLGKGETGGAILTEQAQPSRAERPPQKAAATPENPASQLGERRLQEMIYNFLKAHGPHKALTIMKALGLETKKEVNHNLYDMEHKHLLHHDTNLDVWAVYRPEDSGRRNQPTTVIYQQNPVTMICQNGPNSQISIQNSEGIQIGHGNAMVKQMASGENGSTAPLHLPPTAPADPSAQGLPAGAWGPQDIHLEKSVLRRVQMGHGNEMNSASAPAEGPAHSPFGSHPVSATSAGPETVFETQMPEPGPHPRGDVVQRVHISSCFLEDTTIGNNNRMTASPGAAGPGGVTGPGDSRWGPGEPGEDTDPAPSGGERPGDAGRAAPVSFSTLICQLEAAALESRGPETETKTKTKTEEDDC
ncbi:Z-DNA-binding protein 1 isoform X4 [Equus quagga]|uniref:Z-DNA-binding protein 1 isoform X4 n=1 Tax=Equus quagga TaxID=89248 RepID=UPI001EE19F99|nr:Z-DNA-binding protein 1 isoform X4 [Equus quagga]